MHTRPIIATILLVTFPAAAFAQTPAMAGPPAPESAQVTRHLDVKSIAIVLDDTDRKPVAVPIPRLRPLFQQSASMPCAESEARGHADADALPLHKGWFWGGVGISLLTGVFGVGIAPALAAIAKPKPKTVPANLDPACYTSGFGTKARHERALAGLYGGLVGFGAWLLLTAVADAFD